MLKQLRCSLMKKADKFQKDYLPLFIKALIIKLAWHLADYLISLICCS